MPRNDPPRDRESKFRQYGQENRNRRDLFDSLSKNFGGNRSSTVEMLYRKLEPIWDTDIAPVLIETFGKGTTLYLILYLENYRDELIIELWDPKHIESKPSQVFKLSGITGKDINNLPKDRSKAKIMTLENWHG
ncbi:MAG: hypothetical protein O4861_06060 [Trichodesmium sp. St16_bin4-tuft]|nr:hypothetical protein [Trichodesmium sp. St5_bin8]MDE5077716.1 hypothetical protein [Trichodesmium sp. St2_bin6]MDE5097924.1 hypothetical protein [Trichodesmium sp. St16_bin4-tuft]MDE5105264.1 hypothetical protein [Trichodesmium sp. St19_bin2]